MNNQIHAAEYRPAYTLAKWANFFLIAYAVLMVIAVISDLIEVNLLYQASNGNFVSRSAVDANDNRQALIGMVQFAIFIFSAATFLIWINRAKSNLKDLGVSRVEFSGTWAVWGFFVPFANWVIPFRVVREIWRASHPRARVGRWESIETPSVIGWWWALWVVASISGWVNLRATFAPPDTVSGFMVLSVGGLISDVCLLFAAILAANIVGGITDSQGKSYWALKEESSKSEDAPKAADVRRGAGERNERTLGPAATRAFLVFQNGPMERHRIPLNKDTVSIGRASDNDIVVDDPKVSRHHARFTRDGTRNIVEDTDSSNGTLLNGDRLVKTRLRNGDIIQVGDLKALFTHGEGPLVSLNEIRS